MGWFTWFCAVVGAAVIGAFIGWAVGVVVKAIAVSINEYRADEISVRGQIGRYHGKHSRKPRRAFTAIDPEKSPNLGPEFD